MILGPGLEQEKLWNLIAKVVSGNAAEEEQNKLSHHRKKDPVVKNIVQELRSFGKIQPTVNLIESEIVFHKLLQRIGSLPA
jgi:hypothetical protein